MYLFLGLKVGFVKFWDDCDKKRYNIKINIF